MLKDLLRYKPNALYVGAVLMAIFLVLLGVAYEINHSFTLTFWDKGYELKADFVDADGIANASDIRISGVYVGQVTDIRSVPGGLAEITFRLDKDHVPMHAGTKANLRLQTLLGQKFIELTPGSSSSAVLGQDTVIPSNSTTSPVDFDQLLSSFDKPTREALSKLIQEGGIATDGRGQDINALLTELNQLSVQSAPSLQTFADRGDHVNNILVSGADVTQNLADNRQHLANTLTNFNAILATIAANDPGFRKFLHEGNLSLGHGIAQLDGNQQNLNDTVRLLRPALQKLNPALADVTTIDRSFQSFINIAQVFSYNILADVAGYNQNGAATACSKLADGTTPDPAASGNVGCGGPYIRQPTILVQDPAETTNCEQTTPAPTTCNSSVSSVGAPASVTANSLTAPSLGGPALGGLPGLLPGVLGSGSRGSTASPSSNQDAITSLLHFLLGH